MSDQSDGGKSWSAGFACEIITPSRGIELAGYFQPRPNRGVHDELVARAALFQGGRTIAGFLALDLIFVTGDMAGRIRDELRRRGMNFVDNVSMSATHTHTGPFTSPLFGCDANQEYIESVIEKSVLAVERAYRNLTPSAVRFGKVARNPFAFNRRAILKSGAVLTNASPGSPDVVGVEGPVDRDIGLIAVGENGRLTGLIINITNHCDTTGGDLVSADWPGHLERFIQEATGYQLPVLTLIGCAGNINHLDRNRTPGDKVSGYEASRRIGAGYCAIVLELLQKLDPLPVRALRVHGKSVELRYRTISKKQLKWAKATVADAGAGRSNPMTSEHLATRNPEYLAFFAEQMIRFHEARGGASEEFKIMTIKFGDVLSIVALPGEPFTEIGLRIKEQSPFKTTFVASLSNGTCGYAPMRESFERGGYEVMPVESGGIDENAAGALEEAAVELLSSRSKPKGNDRKARGKSKS